MTTPGMLRTLVILLSALLGAAPSYAWQAEADNLASAAAASVVLFSLCDLPSAPRVAQQTAALLRSHGRRLADESGSAPAEVVEYLLDSANRKVNAFWQANHERGCTGASGLRPLALAYTFPLPR